MNEQQNLNKLYWQSRRGMWELDLMLVPFLQEAFINLSPSEKKLYVKMLSEEDQDLFIWLVKRQTHLAGEYRSLSEKVIEFIKNTDARPH